jgi:hypothetical protein
MGASYEIISVRWAGISPLTILSPREESNLHVQLRRLVFYPLNYRENKWWGALPATNSLEGYCSIH